VKRLSDFVLAHHGIYRTFRTLTGSARVNRAFVEQYVCPSEGDAVLDLGCGPGDVFELMPQVRYVGIDMSENYVAAARRKFGERARFLSGDLNSVEMLQLGPFDRVIAMGVMHHLSDDEVISMLSRVREFLKPDGRFISYDPGFTEPQHPVARWLHKHDRGRFVRFDRQYERLISKVFSSYHRHIRTDLCTVPATVIIFECSRA
jgi:cyclopropane fatty-acyl-phospholipid synthase-like methyltransferase